MNSAEAAARLFAEIETQVQFYDLDPMDIVWHGNYAKYLELARCALLDKIDYNYVQMKASGYAWLVIDLPPSVISEKPAALGDQIKVRVELAEWENRLKLEYLITNVASGLRLTKASTVQVAVEDVSGQMCLTSCGGAVRETRPASRGEPARNRRWDRGTDHRVDARRRGIGAVRAHRTGRRHAPAVQVLLAKPAAMCGRFDQSKTLVGLRRRCDHRAAFASCSTRVCCGRLCSPFPQRCA